MRPSVIYQPSGPASACPYRVLDERGQEITWINAFLDAQHLRQLSLRSLRTYAYDLLHFARWWEQNPPRALTDISQSTLLDYTRHQMDQEPKPTSFCQNRIDVSMKDWWKGSSAGLLRSVCGIR